MKLSLTAVIFFCLIAQATTQDRCPRYHSKVPFYHAYHPTSVDHFYTIDDVEYEKSPNIRYIHEGVTGYIFATQEPSTVPLLHLFHKTQVNHYYTISEALAARVMAVDLSDKVLRGRDDFYTANWVERNIAITSMHGADNGVAPYILG
ncbi:hypothetical protein BDN71DRAFT_1434566 [Pleurotus eryngii]|uniref:DUF5648 domain-containing protein n=1 Tax=Pleurotus eryngii TaxID=5323 RepID=A0A9P6D320_PLEER|nr:hypothetical protein BDN71DRAFT_1434566 [Pleurotus eryngii]